MDVEGILEGIERAISDRGVGRRWVKKFVGGMSPNDLAFAVRTDFDPWAAAVRKYHLDDPRVAGLARLLLRAYWDGRGGIEDSLTDVRRVYNRLARNRGNLRALGDTRTRRYLNRACRRAYDSLYDFVWGIS